jgi:endo-1,4-beta-xylanase
MRRIILSILISLLILHQAQAQLAADKCKFLGNIIGTTTPSDFTKYWNQVTPENAGKWASVEAVRDQMSWTALDNAYAVATNSNVRFKQHTFVWGQQQPTWLDNLSAQDVKAEVEEWISEFCSRYPNTDFIDVVNEPLHAPATYRNALGGNGTTGWDWVVWAFEKARQYCPNAKLFLNDYNIVNSNDATTDYLQIINILKSRDLIDGIGEQGHFLETTGLATIKSNLDRLADTGLPIHISEFDLNIVEDTEQKFRYEQLFPILWQHRAVHGITLWGYKEGEIWRTNAYLIRANGSFRPAFTWLQDYVKNSTGGPLCVPVGVESETVQMQIYPNPSHGRVTVITASPGSTLKIISPVGHVIDGRELNFGNNEINMPGISGVYILIVTDANDHSTYHKIFLAR